ncbi:hypothetical protein SDC9_171847 [bioreactor metagenome]|uniref:Uncharacterized protein n=1 Tax=bioreactor metagenome TaxID=1076179 RepID=A0A645GC01_9ZZZZ
MQVGIRALGGDEVIALVGGFIRINLAQTGIGSDSACRDGIIIRG